MKKIIFDDNLKMTEAVLDGRKTQYRSREIEWVGEVSDVNDEVSMNIGEGRFTCETGDGKVYSRAIHYEEGETVAVAQPYRDVWGMITGVDNPSETLKEEKGWSNRVLTKPDILPHAVKMISVRCERLQDISDEDCVKEGVYTEDGKTFYPTYEKYMKAKATGWGIGYTEPRKAFESLINDINGEDVWSMNPYVTVYEFKLER